MNVVTRMGIMLRMLWAVLGTNWTGYQRAKREWRALYTPPPPAMSGPSNTS